MVLEISSDEDVDWKDSDGRRIPGGGDDHDWLAELLEEVDKETYGDDSDEVVVVSEVSPSEKTGKKSKFKSSLVDLDDDCVILDNDPDKPVEVRNDNPGNGEDDSDDIVVVSEKGQVACRDYPHPRHLCIKFPFFTTPNQSHCDQCYCYVCDSLAPCVYWGNGSALTDHCHATDKDEIWKHQRKNAKNGTKGVQPVADVALTNGLNQHRLKPPTPQLLRLGSTQPRDPSGRFRPGHLIDQNRRPGFPSRNKLHPDLVSKYMLTRHGVRGPTNPGHVPIFKRTAGSVRGGATTANRHHPYAPHRGSFGNSNRQQNYPYSQPNPVNAPVSYPPQSQTYTSPPVNSMFNQQWQPQINPNVQPQVPFYQPSSSRPERAAGQPSYPAPARPLSYPVPSQTRVDAPSISVSDYTQNLPDQGIDNGLNWPAINDTSSVAVGPGGIPDYDAFDWMFDNQPVEPGLIDGHGSYGLTDFSSDNSFIDTGPIFDF